MLAVMSFASRNAWFLQVEFQKQLTKACRRCLHASSCWRAKLKFRDPDEEKKLPVFQYATERSKRRKRVYLWGASLTGALGHDKLVRPGPDIKPRECTHKPYKTLFAEVYQVSDVACGYGFTVFAATADKVKNDNILFGTGLNTDSQLGLQEARKGHPLGMLTEPVGIPLPLRDRSAKVLQVACGRAHTVVLTDKDGVFTLGNNSFGQCGRPVVTGEDYISNPLVHKVRDIPGKIVQVECGQDHTLFLTSDGEVYSCGWGADGQTGLGHDRSQGVPQRVLGDVQGEKICRVATRVDCNLAISEKGELFGWGNSEYGQFSAVTNSQQLTKAVHLKFPHGPVRWATSSGTACAVVNENGEVFVWGFGLLGAGPKAVHSKEPIRLPQPLFRNEPVRQIYSTINEFAAITERGDLYTWGQNMKGCLGIGHTRPQYFPFRVSIVAEVLKVSCGNDHMAALCRSYC
ncbi:RCC1-like G exchanging factor-like protein isoform X2 [Ornithodoros turicata]|uniref:RCC1-like G exchanging factor-like protein isoform X2 n=1 Tax=Ornithodoros turicata TaxID=34597 RepID=UPI003139D06B